MVVIVVPGRVLTGRDCTRPTAASPEARRTDAHAVADRDRIDLRSGGVV
jgi:hypothetical protein